jgi:DNA recombination protein RmuC
MLPAAFGLTGLRPKRPLRFYAPMSIALATLAGVAVGAAGAWLLFRPALAERAARAREVVALQRELATTEARLEAAELSLDQRVRDAIKAVSAEAYSQTNAQLVELAKGRLETTVAPLRESLRNVNEQVQELDRARAQAYGALTRQLSDLNDRTATLATALRSPHVRGRWGEIQLKRVVELAGMLPYCDFAEQVTATGSDGRQRPDLVVRLPGGKQVVVDAKVPLAAYLDAHEANDEELRAQKLADHARQVRDHLAKLSQKAYWQQFADSPDYVVMFLPDEGFFRAAWEQDRELVELGIRSRVHIASPTTLIALLQAIAYGWQQEKVAEDARAVLELGRKLHDSVSVMGGHLVKVGTSLDRAVTAYNQAVASTERRVLPPARKLAEHVVSDKEVDALEPVTSQAATPRAPELAQPAFEILPGDANAA